MIYLIINATAPLHSQPKAESERVDEVLHGMVVTVEEEKGDWLYVETDYRYKGWLHCSNVALAEERDEPQRYINTVAADVLEMPKVQARPLICLTMGCVVGLSVSVGDCESPTGWSRVVLADGREGYVRSVFLSEFPQNISRVAICKTAKMYLNSQYRWGGKSPMGIDCSGLCFMAYYLNGMKIYRDAKIMPGFPIKEISLEAMQEADLLFFPGHVGMCLGDGTMLHSSESGNGVKVELLTPKWLDRVTAVGGISL